MVRCAHRNESLRGLQWQYKTQDKNRLHSSKDYINKTITARSNFGARIDLFAFNSLAFMGAQTDTLQWGHISCLLLYLLRSIGSLEQFRTRSRSSYERACWIGDVRFIFVFCFCFLMFVYQAKIIQYFFYHKPQKNSTVLHSPLPRQISTVYAQNKPQVETVSHCTYPSRVKSLQYIRQPPFYKPHQPLSSFPACLAKHPFPFLPEIHSLRQVANELYGHIY